jgi:hypothetical protein
MYVCLRHWAPNEVVRSFLPWSVMRDLLLTLQQGHISKLLRLSMYEWIGDSESVTVTTHLMHAGTLRSCN